MEQSVVPAPDRERPSIRTTILLTPTEHREWSASARAGGLSMTEFLRRNVAQSAFSLTPEQVEELEQIITELDRMNARIDQNLAEIRESIDDMKSGAFDRRVRARVAAELAANPVEFDPAVLDFSR